MRRFLLVGLIFAAAAITFAAAPDAEPARQTPVGPVGTVASVQLDDAELSKNRQERLHFCVFDNGAEDYIYVGTKYGMWSDGEFELSIDGAVIFSGRVPHLVYEGAIIEMGDVLNEQPRTNRGVHITRITGTFK